MKKTILVIGLLIWHIASFAQDTLTLSLSLEQAQQYALEHNKNLKNSQTDIEIAKKQLWQAISQGLPQVSGTINYNTYFNYQIEFGPGMSISMKDASNATIQVSQLLFSGQYIAGIQIAKVNQLLSDVSAQKSEIDTKESVANTYYLSMITQKSVELIDENVKNLNETLEKTQALLHVGMVEETDVDQLKMSITMLENTKRSLLRNVELNSNIMKFQLGLDYATELVLTENFDGVLETLDLTSVLEQQFNIEENIDIQLLTGQENLYNKMVGLERWAYAPTLAGVYSYTEKLLETDFDMNPKNLLALNLSIPIFSGFYRKSSVDQKKLELLKVQNNKEIVTDQLLMQEKQLRYNLKSAIEQYESQKSNVELAQKIYTNIDRKFRQGIASSFDLIQANTNLLQAQNDYVTSSMELLQAKLAFDKLFNRI